MQVDGGSGIKAEPGTEGGTKQEAGVEGMDVDSVAPPEGEHLSEGQKAAAMGAKRQRKTAAEGPGLESKASASEAHAVRDV